MIDGRPEYAPQSVELAREYSLPLETVEHCIREALEVAAGVEGWSGIPDLNPLIWNYIGSDVLIRVEQHAEMEKAA